MDIERVNIVFNYDMPEDSDTYLHRVARAGRFGTKVSLISIVDFFNLNCCYSSITGIGHYVCQRGSRCENPE